MIRVVYYLFLLPLSKMPMVMLYTLSDFLHLIIYYIVPYRKKVVLQNLNNSFPEKSTEEIECIANRFYHHFCDLIVESIALFSLSEAKARERFKPRNIELLNKLYDQKRSVIIASGHYNNWEMAAVAINPQIKHQADGVYTPLSNKYLDAKFKVSREKFGLIMKPKKQTREMFESHRDMLTATGFGIDQCPNKHAQRLYWMNFLKQDTAVMYGTEKYAKDYNAVVVFMRIYKVKRGYYEFDFQMIEEHPVNSEYGYITERHTRLLEQEILNAPQYWLWTHKRWKLKR